ncbi:hypothetical protein UPYG_G00345810 [Umbra pygmaea]|uniref:IPT/TIG domain-containing protein n=1 Tax=Umbra pygmaea TaxID=75934 RepID=A0ABD0WGG6_UMBPY
MAGRIPRRSEDHHLCVNPNFLTLRNTQDKQPGGMLSTLDFGSNPLIDARSNEDLQFVDGFQIVSHIYIFLNLLKEPKVRLIWFKGKINKATTLKSLNGATLGCCEDMKRPRLLSSTVIQSPAGATGQVLWAGVFTGGNTLNPVNTVVAIYDISPSGTQNKDPDFCYGVCEKPENTPRPPPLAPLAVVFKYSSMTSVLAVRHRSWIVLLIGTKDGQLIKLSVDKNYEAACSKVLYKSDDDRQVFPKMHLDPVDSRHVYMALRNQLMRVPVAQCSKHTSLKECWSAQDPFCGWCDSGSKSRCSFLDDCLQPSVWISIPEDSQQQSLVSYQVEKSSSGEEIKLTAMLHLSVNGTEHPNFACNFPGNLCDRSSPAPVFPQCSCLFSSSKLSTQGLNVTLKIRVGKASLSEKLMLTNCSDVTGPPTSALCSRCITAGCSWEKDVCSWTRSVNSGPLQDVCRNIQSGKNSFDPEIISIVPSVVSYHGRNHALMTGKNLDHVINVHIQGDIHCTTKESPVWNHTGSSLTFHIPSGDKGSVSVCAVLPDGRCLGKTLITYRSSPTCTGILPATAWASGNRRIKILGSHLELVDGVVHGHDPQVITINTSSGELWYHTPKYDVNTNLPVTSTVYLKVANLTLACSQLTYHPDPKFNSFTVTKTGNDLQVTIEKNADELNITTSEISVLGVQEENQDVECVMEKIKTSGSTDYISCDIKNAPYTNIKSLRIKVGNNYNEVTNHPSETEIVPLIFSIFIAIILIISVILCVLCYSFMKQRNVAAQFIQPLELQECDRHSISEGKASLMSRRKEERGQAGEENERVSTL